MKIKTSFGEFGLEFHAQGRMTQAVICDIKGDGTVYEGTVTRNVNDQDNRVVARVLALQRALTAAGFTHAEKAEFFEACPIRKP